MTTNLRNIFGTVVHDVPEGTTPIELRKTFGTVVHDVPEGTTPIELRKTFGTVVHDVPEGTTPIELRKTFATAVHDADVPFLVPNISGTVGISASFDASSQSLDPASSTFHWSWNSVPAGSSFGNSSYPLPDNGVNTYFDMTNNQGLWHFEGNADDSSGNSKNGTTSNVILAPGKIGAEGYQIIGSGLTADTSYIDFGLASGFLSPASSFSMAIWMKGDGGWTPALYDGVLGFSNSFSWTQGVGIFWLNATTIRSFVGAWNAPDTVEGNIAVVDDWSQIVITYDGSDLSLYINGSLADTSTVGAALTGLSNNLQVGRLGNHGRLEATLDEFSIWDRQLSPVEVGNLFFLQSGSVASDLSGNVGLGETFTFVPDASGTYETNLNMTEGASISAPSLSGSVYAYISSATPPGPGPDPIITASNPQEKLVTAVVGEGYALNTYKILSVQRARKVDQIPFTLGTKGISSLRLRTNQDFSGSA